MKKRTQRLAKIFIASVTIALIAYFILDEMYFHVLFSPENVTVMALVQILIVVVGFSLVVLIQRTEKPMHPSSSTPKKSNQGETALVTCSPPLRTL